MAAAVLGLLVGFRSLMAAFGTGAYLAAVLLIAAAIAIGCLLGTRGQGNKPISALGAGHRNISAALLIGTTNFTDPTVILMVLVVSVVGLVLLFLTAGAFGKRAEAAGAGEQPPSFSLEKGDSYLQRSPFAALNLKDGEQSF